MKGEDEEATNNASNTSGKTWSLQGSFKPLRQPSPSLANSPNETHIMEHQRVLCTSQEKTAKKENNGRKTLCGVYTTYQML